jgi:hypothetical protein
MVDLEQKRRKLGILYHAAHCRHDEVGDCDKQRYCCAAKRVFLHMVHCRRNDCDVPGCKKCRSIWRHYRKCQDRHCVLCSAVPTRYNSKAMSPRFKTFTSFSSDESLAGESNTTGSMSVLSGKRRRRRNAAADQPSALGGKENVVTEASASGQQDSSAQAEEQGAKTRPPLSPRRPMWALF